ncbi:MAG: methyl-accepting chemotaxis protein [Desulfobacter sp.]|nr:MAG: methyl-accepting chemotaxis protein [Desulfobacter sp.]
MKVLIDSVGKKISLIIILSILSSAILMMVSFSFFGKIAQIGNIVKSAYDYEVLMGTAKFEFEKFKATKKDHHLDGFNKAMARVTRTDGTIGAIYRLMDQGMSASEAVVEFRNTGVDANEGQEAAANLINTLMGHPLLVNMVDVAEKAHGMSTRWEGLVKDYAGTTDSGQKAKQLSEIDSIVGDLPALLETFHGAMKDVADHLSATIKRIFLIIGGVMVGLIIGIAIIITRSITKPLAQTVTHVNDIADGDFLNTLEIKNTDELGTMVKAMNQMGGRLKEMVLEIKKGIDTLNSSVGDLSSFSDQMSENASSNAEKSNIVAAAAEEMSINMASVSDSMETSAQNTNSVVTAVEEMTATINEIAKNTETAKTIAQNAVSQSRDAADQMTRLDKAALSIGQVTEAIRDISSQTDLLSLNATIEAARAG